MKRWSGLLLLLFLAACARPERPVWTVLPSAENLLTQISTTTGRVSSLDAAAKVGLSTRGKYVSSQQFLLLKKPDLLRTDVLTGFGQLVLQLTSDGNQLAVFMNTTVPGRFYQGPASAENLARFTRIPLATGDMLRLLLYDPPLIAATQTEVVADGETLLLRLENSELRQEVLFDEQLQPVGSRYFSGQQQFLEVLYQRFDKELQFPQTIRVKLIAEETEVTIKLSELVLNAEIKAERFRLQKPENAQLEMLP